MTIVLVLILVKEIGREFVGYKLNKTQIFKKFSGVGLKVLKFGISRAMEGMARER